MGSRRRWYGDLMSWKGPVGRVQVESLVRSVGRTSNVALTLPEPILRLAQDEYDRQFPGQPYERMQERGGLGVLEIIGLLADSLERHGVTATHSAELSGP